MKHLLDVNVLLAAIWEDHPLHSLAFDWLEGRDIILCPLTELGFLRVSTNGKAINAPMDKARELLSKFAADRKAEWIADDLPALDSHSKTSGQITDQYLAELAAKHGAKLATLDKGITHRAAVVI